MGVAAAALLALAGAAAAEAPSGPRLALVRLDNTQLELVSVDAAGFDTLRLAGGRRSDTPLPYPYSPASWSPDGSSIVFSGLSGAGPQGKLDLYSVAADGSGLRRLKGTRNGYEPVFSPDGHTIAFSRSRQRTRRVHHRQKTVYDSASIWLLDLQTGSTRRITSWRNGLFQFPSSFSPDGSVLALSRRIGRGKLSAVALRIDGGGSSVIAADASEPVFSPDGTRIAFIRATRVRRSKRAGGVHTLTDLYEMRADGSGLVRLTNTRREDEVVPRWDPSGQRLAYTQLDPSSAVLGLGDSIMEINADGSCRTRVLSFGGAVLYGATWQPGPSRGAGPISC